MRKFLPDVKEVPELGSSSQTVSKMVLDSQGYVTIACPRLLDSWSSSMPAVKLTSQKDVPCPNTLEASSEFWLERRRRAAPGGCWCSRRRPRQHQDRQGHACRSTSPKPPSTLPPNDTPQLETQRVKPAVCTHDIAP